MHKAVLVDVTDCTNQALCKRCLKLIVYSKISSEILWPVKLDPLKNYSVRVSNMLRQTGVEIHMNLSQL